LEVSGVQILIGVVSILITTVGALGALLLRRLEKGNDLLISIDKKLAVMEEKVKITEITLNKLDNRQMNDFSVLNSRIEMITRENDKQDLSLFELKTEQKEIKKALNNFTGE
jgi:hypothetical protein